MILVASDFKVDIYSNQVNIAYNGGGAGMSTAKATTAGFTVFRDLVEDAFANGTTSIWYKGSMSYIIHT